MSDTPSIPPALEADDSDAENYLATWSALNPGIDQDEMIRELLFGRWTVVDEPSIPPALNEREWAAVRESPPQVLGAPSFDEAAPLSPLVKILSPSLNQAATLLGRRSKIDALATVIALAMHTLPDGHANKITWAMVDEIRRAVEFEHEFNQEQIDAVHRIAAVLASYLPPR